MPNPDLTPEDNLRELLLLSEWGHAFARVAETMNPDPGSPAEYLHARMADGAIITWDEGKVSFSRSEEGEKITLQQIDAEIDDAERDAR
jgi:hypothetical protein